MQGGLDPGVVVFRKLLGTGLLFLERASGHPSNYGNFFLD
jgi:hypothetical protein